MSVSIKNLVSIAEEQVAPGDALRRIHMDDRTRSRYGTWSVAVMTFCPEVETRLRQGDINFVSIALKKGMRSARSIDAHRLKELAGRFASETVGTQIGLDGDSKMDRGFNHNKLGRLLIPVEYIKEYDRDPICMREKVKGDARYKVTAHRSPAFLYEDPDDYNPKHVLQGFLRGKFLVFCFRAIFTGPRGSIRGPSMIQAPTRTGMAGIYGLLTVKIPMIAYSAVQARFALSEQQTWTGNDGAFSYEVFFETLLKVFEVDRNWGKETLSWWNEQIFGHRDGLASLRSTEADASDGILAKAMAQAENRRADELLAAAAERTAMEEPYREVTPSTDPLDNEPSDNEASPPSRRRTPSTRGTPGGDDDDSGEEHDRGGLPALQSRKQSVQRVASQHEGDHDDLGVLPARQSQKRSSQQRESSQREDDNDQDNDSASEGRHQNGQRSPQRKSKRSKTTSHQR